MADGERWVTTKTGKHIKLDEDGNPIAGNPYVTKMMANESSSAKPSGGKRDYSEHAYSVKKSGSSLDVALRSGADKAAFVKKYQKDNGVRLEETENSGGSRVSRFKVVSGGSAPKTPKPKASPDPKGDRFTSMFNSASKGKGGASVAEVHAQAVSAGYYYDSRLKRYAKRTK